ncbi:AAA family ATPase [Lentzea sp. NPDC006480]|uniref:AAA family ATPase n=1 Tax=Lentzea sp. NPDC006480 TaxID=3157176 RepID=UPI00339F10F9
MPTLIHLNGPTGVGKSTIAARYAAAHPKTLNLDADEIVRLVGGWQDDFFGTVDLVRPLAITIAQHHLASGHDVVMPQLVNRHDQRDLFAQAARSAGADYRELVLLAPAEVAVERFRERAHHIDAVVEKLGGEALINRVCGQFAAYVTPESLVIQTAGQDLGETYETVIAALTRWVA